MENNIIRLPIGRRMPPETDLFKSECEENLADLSYLDLFRLGDIRYLTKAINLIMLMWKNDTICLSFQIEPEKREWLRKHEGKVRDALSQIVVISTADEKRMWEIDSHSPIWLDFPDEYPDRLRVGLIAREITANSGDTSSPFKLWKESVILSLHHQRSAKKWKI